MLALGGLLLGLFFAVGATPLSMSVARSLRILDFPGENKIHREPTPRFGGFGIVMATLLAFVATVVAAGSAWRGSVPVLAGSLLAAFTGAIDDIRNLRPLYKLQGQLLSGAIFVALSWSDFGAVSLPSIIQVFYAMVAVFFLSFMSNSLNLLDGMDGLAAGTTVIMAVFLSILASAGERRELALLLTALTGACLGFLAYNVPPARTFMGDSGSLFLGYTIAVAGLQVGCLPPLSVSRALGIMLVLLVPIADTCLAIIRRLKGHENVLSGDRRHFYDCLYRLLDGNPWRTLGVMWTMTLVCGTTGVFVFLFNNVLAAVFTTVLVIACMLLLAAKVGVLETSSSVEERRLRM